MKNGLLKIVVTIIIISFLNTNAQTEVKYFPGSLNVQPFSANNFEPALGFIFKTSQNELQMNISNSLDLIQIKQNEVVYSFGADLFTYTLLRSENEFHFPVDAVDYLFGINFGMKKTLPEYEIGGRLRISHISAHFVDGHFDKEKKSWRDEREPQVYSREFLELLSYFKLNSFRFYGGLTYIFHVEPSKIGKWNFQAGTEYFFKRIKFAKANPFIAYNFRLNKIEKFYGNNTLKVGVKFGRKWGRGFSLFYYYFSGKSIHGEYFDVNENFSAVGFNLDL